MTKTDIQKQVISVVAKQFDIEPNKISGNLNFQKDLDGDSIDLIELLMALENKFNTKIPDSDAQKLETVNEVVDYINQHQK